MYRHAPGTIWRRALARHDRRAATLRSIGTIGSPEPTPEALYHYLMLKRDVVEAASLANRLYFCAYGR